MNHTSLLNFLADKIKAKSYLEIGIQEPRQNFDKINCEYKVGVDPAIQDSITPKRHLWGLPSDEFFQSKIAKEYKDAGFDLCFIDGLHCSEQVERDFNNCLESLNDGGYILIHDCLPTDEITSLVPRQSKCWHGSVYQFIMKLHTYSDIDFATLNMDNGCCVVWKEPGKQPNTTLLAPIDWQSYQTFGKAIMNVIEPSVFFESAKSPVGI